MSCTHLLLRHNQTLSLSSTAATETFIFYIIWTPSFLNLFSRRKCSSLCKLELTSNIKIHTYARTPSVEYSIRIHYTGFKWTVRPAPLGVKSEFVKRSGTVHRLKVSFHLSSGIIWKKRLFQFRFISITLMKVWWADRERELQLRMEVRSRLKMNCVSIMKSTFEGLRR